MKKSMLTPLLFAAILFLMIRLTNDLPAGARYLSHSWGFMAIEVAGVVAGSFLCDYLSRKWMAYVTVNKIYAGAEYAAVVLVPACLCVLVMVVSHGGPLSEELPDLVIPVVITVLMSIWLYLTMKSRYLSRLYVESRLRLMRSQFHPHFLFNMLNTVYFTIDEANGKARDTVEHLSNLLRSQLYEGEAMVTVEREVSALESYLELCRMRFGDSMVITAEIDVEGKMELHPHLLLPLVENAVKHSGGDPRRVDVTLRQDADSLELSVWNTVSARKAASGDKSGLGLPNLRTMLELLYPGRYELKTEIAGSEFRSYLKMELR